MHQLKKHIQIKQNTYGKMHWKYWITVARELVWSRDVDHSQLREDSI